MNDDNPMLYEQHRRTIGSKFMKRLCERNSDSMRNNGVPAMLTLDEIWNKNLGAYKQDNVAPLVIHYFENVRRYIVQHPDGRISLTAEGGAHCNDPEEQFTLPANYQP